MPKIRKIEASALRPAPRKKVAAYCRVSEASENLLHSLSAQVSYYNDLIQKTPEWVFAGVYADRAITGTSTAKRDELNRMLADCDDGKIDIVLVKAISRFARNTLDTLKMVRHLKKIGVEVRFERENISSFSGDGELMLTILASFAQEESRCISENVRWGIRKRFEEGEQNGYKAPYGYYWDGEMYRQIPEQAEVVRLIFDRYLAGVSPFQIRDELSEKGYTSQEGKKITDSTIRTMISNPSYTGVQILQKSYIDENHRRIANQTILPKYMVEDMYEPIITKEEYERAQEIKQERQQYGPKQDADRTRYSGKVRCGICKSSMSRRTTKFGKKWVCNCRERKGMAVCDSNPVQESELDALTDRILGSRNFNREIEMVTVYNERLEFLHTNGKTSTLLRSYDGRHDAFSGRLLCGCCGEKIIRSTDHWRKKGMQVEATYYRCQSVKSKCDLPRLTEEDLLLACKETLGTELSPQLIFSRDAKRTTLYRNRLEFEERNGGVKTWQRK